MKKHQRYDKKKIIEPRVHRRLLGFLNKARTIKELTADPGLGIKPDLAKAIFEKRATVGAFGFRDIAERGYLSVIFQ